MGGHSPREKLPPYDHDEFEREWAKKEIGVAALEACGMSGYEASEVYNHATNKPEFYCRGNRRFGSVTWWRADHSGTRSAREYHNERVQRHERALAQLRLARLKPRRLAARAAGRAARNMRKEFLHRRRPKEEQEAWVPSRN
jgi:hypothetical protein